jgi:hypothetical protein
MRPPSGRGGDVVTRKCCRATPRCAACPARLSAAGAAQRRLGEPGALVAEILAGGRARPLPASVAAALASLELTRTPR